MLNLKDLIAAKKADSEQRELGATKEQSQEPNEPVSIAEALSPKALEAAKPAARSFAELMAARKAAAQQAALAADPMPSLNSLHKASPYELAPALPAELLHGSAGAAGHQESFALDISLNAQQLLAKEMALAGKSFCLIGAAGTGKTTTQRSVAEQLLKDKRLSTCTFKTAGQSGSFHTAPSIAFCAYTRRAAANLQRAIHKLPELEAALEHNIMTIHALLEYQPVFFYDEEKQRESMRFEPKRNALNPLDITHLVIEEASMVGLDLWERLFEALRPGVQIIFIGDINQLPPVFGPSILNYALVQLPVVELTEVYRQAGDSAILSNAHKILKGEMVEAAPDFQIVEGKSNTQVSQAKMARALARIFEQWYHDGFYNPEEDMILSPFNKQDLGTDNMNKYVAQFIGMAREATVYEVVAGFNKLYLAVGDKVMCNKQDGIIEAIVHNGDYMGKQPAPASKAMTRFGGYIAGHEHGVDLDEVALSYENFSVEALADEATERKQAASHVVKVRMLDDDRLVELRSAGELGPQVFSLGYVLTVHKAQGCEWRKVFFIQHKDHAIMRFRELIYTAVTRARQELIWIGKKDQILAAIKNPRIKGNNIADKIEYFNANLDMSMNVQCVKPEEK